MKSIAIGVFAANYKTGAMCLILPLAEKMFINVS